MSYLKIDRVGNAKSKHRWQVRVAIDEDAHMNNENSFILTTGETRREAIQRALLDLSELVANLKRELSKEFEKEGA